MISYKELVAKTMPPEKRKASRVCLLSFYLLRPIENILSIVLIALRVTAMTITWLGFVSLIIALICFLLIPEKIGVTIGLLCVFGWNICDGIDGNIARYTDTCSKKGELWDNVCDYLAPCVFYIGMGITAYNCYDISDRLMIIPNDAIFVYMGFLIALGHIFTRLVMYRKISLFGENAGKGFRVKLGEAGFMRLFVQNITSVNGIAFLIFVICYKWSLMEYCIILYFLIYICIVLGSLYKLLKIN